LAGLKLEQTRPVVTDPGRGLSAFLKPRPRVAKGFAGGTWIFVCIWHLHLASGIMHLSLSLPSILKW
jgi:hypothetical protein